MSSPKAHREDSARPGATPRSNVSHNVCILGKSGAKRQIDVLVLDRIDQYDIQIILNRKAQQLQSIFTAPSIQTLINGKRGCTGAFSGLPIVD